MQTGLTFSPKANPASPAVNMFLAAFTSRSWTNLQSGHFHVRVLSESLDNVYPQALQRLLDGYHLSMPTKVLPYHLTLYSNCRINSDQPAPAISRDNLRFLSIWDTARLSTAITWFSLINLVESLCKKSLRISVIFAWSFATFNRALFWLLEPSSFLLNRFCNKVNFTKLVSKDLGDLYLLPAHVTAKSVKPKSIPILETVFALLYTESSHSSETKYLPAQSLLTVTVVNLASFGNVLDHLTARGSFILAKVKTPFSNLNALAVYSAD